MTALTFLTLIFAQNVAEIDGHQFEENQFFFQGPETGCASNHHHALNGVFVTALDGFTLSDPGGCGYGLLTFSPLNPPTTPSQPPGDVEIDRGNPEQTGEASPPM